MRNLTLIKLSLLLGNLVNGAAFTITFPFGSLLVQKLGMADDRSSTGYWVGVLAFSMMSARTIFSPIWGLISDKWGRRPTVIFGIVSMIVFSILFGFSSTFWMALISRFLIGALCCIVLNNNAMIVEFSKSDPGSTAWLIIGWQCGHILGNIIGGVLAEPYETGVSDWLLFKDYPFLLPNIVISLIGVVCLIAYILFVPETTIQNEQIETQSRSYCELLKDKKAQLNLLLFFFWTTAGIGFQEIIPLFCWADKKDGGLGMNTIEIGNILGISGLVLLFVEAPFYKLMRKFLNIVQITRYFTIASIVIAFGTPVASLVNEQKIATYVTITSFTFCWFIIDFVITSSLINMQNNCVANAERGKMNAIFISTSSIGKGTSPLILGSVFASTTKSSLPYPFNFAFAFNLMSVCALIAFLCSLSKHLDLLYKPQVETQEEEPLLSKAQ